jgi:glutamate dehydrogenase (NADP+)
VKQNKRGRLSLLDGEVSGEYVVGKSPWTLPDLCFDYAFPCATQNEIEGESAAIMIKNGMKAVFEGANLPTTLDAQKIFRENSILYIPGKASNAGGVAVSGFEMSQNAQRLHWTAEEVDAKLRETMASIYQQMETMSKEGDVSLEEAANRVGFMKVANAMKDLGWVW